MGGTLLPGAALALAACVSFYLASPHQGSLRAPLPAWPARGSGALLLVCSLVSLGRTLQVVPAVFLLCTCVMTFLVLLPYLSALPALLRNR